MPNRDPSIEEVRQELALRRIVVVQLAEDAALAPLTYREVRLMILAMKKGEEIGAEEEYRKENPTQP